MYILRYLNKVSYFSGWPLKYLVAHFMYKTGFFPSYILVVKLESLNILISVLHRRDSIENRKFFNELINVLIIPGRSQQKNRQLKRAAQSCSKLTDLLKKARPDDSFSTDEMYIACFRFSLVWYLWYEKHPICDSIFTDVLRAL